MTTRNTVRACLLMASLATPLASARAVPASHAPLSHVDELPRDPADALLGQWRPPNGEVVVAITRSGSTYVGTAVASPKHPELVGKELFRGLTYDAAHAAWRGQVLAVKKGEYVPAAIRLEHAGAFVLTAGSGLLTKEIRWTRAP